MSEFVNTVDVVGDSALMDSIIDRSVTELIDDQAESIGEYACGYCQSLTSVQLLKATQIGASAFSRCTALKKVVLKEATLLSNSAFGWCSSLETVDIYKPANLTASLGTPFAECTSLKTLILRGDSCSTIKSGYLKNSPIAIGTGYIYVPRALVDSYKTATGWSGYAAQIRAIEDYPEVCDPYSWEAVAKAIEAGTYKDVYKIGDCVPVDLGAQGIINMQIADFDTDSLADGSGTAAISWVAKDLLTTGHRMNPNLSGTTEGTGAIGGWEKCEMRSYLQNTIKPLIPADAARQIVAVTKQHVSYNTAGGTETQTTTDEIWIPSNVELNTSNSSTNKTCYELFWDVSRRIKTKVGSATATTWWTRAPNSTSQWKNVGKSGSFSNGTPQASSGVCLGFCTGRTPA